MTEPAGRPRWPVVGHAIVSDDDAIADAQGRMPEALRNDADWTMFQAALDASAITVLGRLGHEAHPNPRGRLRMVVSSRVASLERRPDGWWWNPAGLAFPDAMALAVPGGGTVAVPGGQRVFDLFLAIGYAGFQLTRARGVRIPDGIRLFGTAALGETAEATLARHGLQPGAAQVLDTAAGVTTVLWRSRSGER